MLLHELQHYKHKDILVGYLINTANVFYWFNPLIGYFLKKIRQERELACDSAVLQLLKETEYKSYGNTLINFAETIALSPFPLTMGISGNIKQLKGRILNIASFHQPTFKTKNSWISYMHIRLYYHHWMHSHTFCLCFWSDWVSFWHNRKEYYSAKSFFQFWGLHWKFCFIWSGYW